MSEENEAVYCDLTYKGKTLDQKGSKNGKEWKKYSLLFENDQSQYDTKMKCFDSVSANGKSIPIKDLEEGDTYSVGYRVDEWTHPQHGQIKSKQIFYINIPKNDAEYKDIKESKPEAEAETQPVEEEEVVDTPQPTKKISATKAEVDVKAAFDKHSDQAKENNVVLQFIKVYVEQCGNAGVKMSRPHFVGTFLLNNTDTKDNKLITEIAGFWDRHLAKS